MADEQDIQFPINQALLEDAQKIKQERSLIKERIAKIEAKKNEVRPTVYQKVKHDYSAKLNEITNSLLEKKTDIDRELSTLYEARTRVTENLEQHKEALDEIKFRNTLGEYEADDFNRASREETEKIGKFEKILSAVNSNIEKYESIFADVDDIIDTPEPSVKKLKAGPEKPLEGSDYAIAEEEGDYFSPEGEESSTPLAAQTDITKKTAVAGGVPRLIIIEGEYAGRDYKLKKENTIGRANSNMVVLKDAKVSRQHAMVKQTGSEFMIIDLNSSNGVIVNHEKVKEHVLSDGDQIQIGDHTLQFKL